MVVLSRLVLPVLSLTVFLVFSGLEANAQGSITAKSGGFFTKLDACVNTRQAADDNVALERAKIGAAGNIRITRYDACSCKATPAPNGSPTPFFECTVNARYEPVSKYPGGIVTGIGTAIGREGGTQTDACENAKEQAKGEIRLHSVRYNYGKLNAQITKYEPCQCENSPGGSTIVCSVEAFYKVD
ncbi:hypothetical protein [Hyphomonas sp. CACIAM 19H1]|uniref:hypothetical protein n=1 Tax=Hyphomonas sp. CACIAM 19H1 TaxID=1873716 RepID=UPI0013B06505|nr:hypothetical protein [Hyphomonas sp. CACIAM 19H1]